MLANIFWWIQRWKMGDIRYLTSKCSKKHTTIINEKLEEVFNKLDSAAKVNISLGFVPQNIETTGEYRYFYAQENITLCEKSPLLCTKADLITI